MRLFLLIALPAVAHAVFQGAGITVTNPARFTLSTFTNAACSYSAVNKSAHQSKNTDQRSVHPCPQFLTRA